MPASRSSRPRPVAALATIPAVAAVLLLGVWVAGGVISDDYRTSMALTGAWFLLSGAACLAIARRARAVRIPVIATYVVAAGAVGAYLAATTLQDRVVSERVVTASPAPATPPARGQEAPARAMELASGRFRSHEHDTSGRATVVRLADGRRFLTLTSFATSAGPDLRVRLVPGDSSDGGARGAVDLGALKGNRGDQQYRLPADARLAGRSVVIWCRAFSAPFGSAALRES
jgi:Electron transfer DM13